MKESAKELLEAVAHVKGRKHPRLNPRRGAHVTNQHVALRREAYPQLLRIMADHVALSEALARAVDQLVTRKDITGAAIYTSTAPALTQDRQVRNKR